MYREKTTMTSLKTSRALQSLLGVALSIALAACSGGGAETQENPVTTAPIVNDYNGPAAQNADVQAFRNALWQFIRASNRCGGCHGANGQAPTFARNDNVNLAYDAAVTIVNLTQPDQSRMVTKVAGGHNCWLAAASACADTLTVWIRNWAGAAATGGTQIQLQAPTIKEVGQSKTFPESSALFAQYVWPVVRPINEQRCQRCHTSSAGTPQSPFFASDDVDEAYAAARSKINLDNPAQSRFVVRLREEFHNCWDTSGDGAPDCVAPGADNDSADRMQKAIEDFAGQIPLSTIDAGLVTSKALTLYDGTVAAGGNRVDTNLIALYEFKTGQLDTAYDTSGVEPALNLQLSSADMWVGGWGINVKAGQKAQGSTAASRKLSDMIKATGEFSIEAWMAPANVVQEDAYAVTYSGGATARNFTIAQRAYQYEALLRTNETGANGTPLLITNAADRDAQASLQHVVLTFDPVNGRRLYVNGVFTGDADPQGGGGSLADWDDSFAFVLGNETSNNRQWQGVLRLVGIHNRALTLDQIQQNFAAGVGERYFMLFSVSHLTNVPQSYIMFEAAQMDSYGYLFSKPTFISLDATAAPSNLDISGIRIGVNGAEAKAGQAYIPLSATVGGANYTAASGQLLEPVGTVIALEKGPVADEFFLSFERIGTNTHSVVYADPPEPTVDLADFPTAPQVGVRTFEEINATLSTITGVPITNTAVNSTYQQVKQQLPTTERVDAFLAAQQSAVAQLAIKYCSVMVDTPALRSAFWGGDPTTFDLTGVAGRNQLINPIIDKGSGTGALTSQPDPNDIRTELGSMATVADGSAGHGSLIDRLCAGGNCNAARKAIVAKAACGAVLGSGAQVVQ
jgi:mono/diheme cytochrome c family protein